MIIWNPLSKHFYRFAHFFRMHRVLRLKKCVPLSLLRKRRCKPAIYYNKEPYYTEENKVTYFATLVWEAC